MWIVIQLILVLGFYLCYADCRTEAADGQEAASGTVSVEQQASGSEFR